ncbi:MAG: hypothetical protein C0511_13240 [Hyphomicrobium sp.]|nr:hypothetical protein [Hyphomicrobium sp.]PPD28424.1 MAG: hypothetical protein CTY20_10070 [Hyphomicrobium sp.]
MVELRLGEDRLRSRPDTEVAYRRMKGVPDHQRYACGKSIVELERWETAGQSRSVPRSRRVLSHSNVLEYPPSSAMKCVGKLQCSITDL